MPKLIVEQLNITQVTGKLVNLTVTQHPRLLKLIEMLKLDIEDVSVALKTIKVLWGAKCLEKEHRILMGVVDKRGIIHTVMLKTDDHVEFYGN
ncbi:hypothetical protein AGENTSMITH_14 [Bacillus phage vB_BspM_AgentSmith]|nr:hypothetical protein AGENTSMITH_14 [Bacillus phage vB_BspM_AgentSmith]